MKKEENKESLEIKIKTLDFLQSIISRMTDNSFKIKGWTVALNVGLFTLLILLLRMNDIKYGYLISIIFMVSIIMLSILDAYYLKMERSFKSKYENVAAIGLEETDRWNFDLRPN